ncbi:hypothetical protein Focb16_v009839 [Fusarium oxysporum f. sp. cubense]|uniref:Uncharacterized protein n=1 Tax=Fusarium oxysporum f. sp. cubense TaxID=61366 RepID=A0A559L3F0_FUSOC|nr:hypothetical protein Focb16_v009839 [Fusarium oxysporum f. sp. cubense]
MELVGIIRCPVHLLLPYGEGRQIDPDAVRRLANCFDKTECRRQEADNFVRGIVTYDDLRFIISALNTSESALKHTILQKQYPLLSDRPIACLDGRHRIRAAMRHEPLSWWVVKLLCVQGSWVDFPRKIALVSVDDQTIQDKIEATSREAPYSDAEIYRLLRKYKKQNDKLRFKERLNRLSAPKQISVKGFLKRELLVQDLDALLKYPGVIAGLQFGNVHKHLALHIDENISRFLKHILQVWDFITNDEPRINSAVDIQTVRCLQFRAPISSYSDRIAIHRMFNEGLLFEGLKDLDLREQVRRRVLSVQVIIPSMETFHENMKYISIGAKILRKYLMETPIRVPGEPKQPNLTVFESLASCWSAETRSIEVKDGEMSTSPDTPTAWFAYETVFLAALRDFARLSSEHPRQDVRGETMPAFAEASRIVSLGQLAYQLGFKNSKVQEMLANPSGHPTVGSYECKDGRPADWRGGIPFTKSYSQLRAQAFIPMLDSPVSKGDDVSSLFVIRDTFNAFFRGSMAIAYVGLIEPLSLDFWASNQLSHESCISSVEPQDISMSDLEEDIIMGENETVKGRVRKHKRLSTFNVLRPKSCRIEKKQVEPKADETIIRSFSRSPPRIPAVQDAEHEPVLDATNILTGTVPHSIEESIARQDHRDPLLLDEEISQDQPLTNAEIMRDAQMDSEEEPSDSIQTILRQDHRDPLPCDNLERTDHVLSADNQLTGNHEGHSKTEQIRDALESNTSEPPHQEMTQFESEEDLFDLSNNSDAGPEEMIETADPDGPLLTEDATEEQTGTIERQDQRSPPPIHDMEEESATQQIIRHAGATERQDQQSLPDAETECIIEEQAEAIEIWGQRNPLPMHGMEEEPATQQIEWSEATKGRDQQDLTNIEAEYTNEQGQRVAIKEQTETMEIRDQRTPPPMQHISQQTESSEASERQQSLPDIGIEYTNKQAYQVGIEEQAETMRRRDERTPPPMQHTGEESTAQQTEPSEVSEWQQGQRLRIKETEIMRRQDQRTPPHIQDIPGQSRAPESPPPQIPKSLAGIKRKRDSRSSESSSSHGKRVINHFSDPQPVVPPQPVFPTIYGRIRRDEESVKIQPVRRLQPQRNASKDTGGASKSRG